MPRLSVLNHPVHPILQALPASLLPASTTFDALVRLGVDKEGLSKAGHYTLAFGLVGAVGAATTGVLDYYEIENRPVRKAGPVPRTHQRGPCRELRSELSTPQGSQGGRHSLGTLRVRSSAHWALRLPRGRVGIRARGAGRGGPRRHPRGVLEEEGPG
jgi:hypothetical protein